MYVQFPYDIASMFFDSFETDRENMRDLLIPVPFSHKLQNLFPSWLDYPMMSVP